jgi:uncharacterized coiled-coil protein SlyX
MKAKELDAALARLERWLQRLERRIDRLSAAVVAQDEVLRELADMSGLAYSELKEAP